MAEGLIALAAKRALRTSDAIDAAARPVRRVLRPLPLRGDGRPAERHRRRAGGPGQGHADGPADLRRRRLRQDRGGAARRLRRGHERSSRWRIVCPTTLLARQHFKTFSERFAGLADQGAAACRAWCTAKEAAETRAGLARTASSRSSSAPTRCCSEQVGFKDLGLVIVDEEQHFGVKHKEKLKSPRADVHLLTLTATPIPRTLQMALSGIREMSIIATPPVDRLAVRTYVTPWDPVAGPRGPAAREVSRRSGLLSSRRA